MHQGKNQKGQQSSTYQHPNLVATNRCCRRHSLARMKYNAIPHLSDRASLSKNWFLKQIISGLHKLVKGSGIGSYRPGWPQVSEMMQWEVKGVELRSGADLEPEIRSQRRSTGQTFKKRFQESSQRERFWTEIPGGRSLEAKEKEKMELIPPSPSLIVCLMST